MQFDILLSDEARTEVANSYLFYESKSEGLGESFLHELEAIYTSLGENPFKYSFIDLSGKLRDVKLRRFPYVVIFEIQPDFVFVYSVYNTSRRQYRVV